MDGILLTEHNGNIVSANRSAGDIFNMTEQEIITAGRTGLLDMQDPRVQHLSGERERVGSARGEITFKSSDGSRFAGEISTSVFADAFGNENTSLIVCGISERTLAGPKIFIAQYCREVSLGP